MLLAANDSCPLQMNSLISHGIVEPYGALVDVKGSYTAQFEHVSRNFKRAVGKFALTLLRRSYSTPTVRKLSAAALTTE